MSRDDDATIEVPGTVDERALELRDKASLDALLAKRYRLARLMGRGGMGEVIAARDEQIGRDVAIKRMKAAKPSGRAIERFLREASIQGRLDHPAIVPVHEIGLDHDGLPFFAMKKLTGTTLAKILGEDRARGPLQRDVLRAFADVCLAVEFAHVRGVIHRDLNPNNVMLGDFGEVYILDWGVAKVVGEDDGEFADVDSGSGEHATAVGTAIGTPGYMAPEQVRGWTDIDGRVDIYTLGCLLFEILAGEPLHPRGAGLRSALDGIDARPSARAPGRDIPPELDALCVQATALDREQRVATARELGDRVQRYLDGDRDLALRRQLARGHLERATAAFAAGDTDELRREAMREAAAALALDPALGDAAALVGRLMLEPPRVTPREVEAAIAEDDIRTSRVNAKAGTLAAIASIAFVPLVWWMSPEAAVDLAALIGLLVLSGAVAFHNLRAATPRVGLAVACNALLVAWLARMFSPILVAPGIASVLAIAMVVTPRISRFNTAVAVALLMIAGALAPWILEYAGVLPRTMTATGHGLWLDAPAVLGEPGPIFLVTTLYIVCLIAGATAMAEAMRIRIRNALGHLHLQAWQLRQLVPR